MASNGRKTRNKLNVFKDIVRNINHIVGLGASHNKRHALYAFGSLTIKLTPFPISHAPTVPTQAAKGGGRRHAAR